MNTFRHRPGFVAQVRPALAAALVLILLFSQTGCLTSKGVKKIVSESNDTMLTHIEDSNAQAAHAAALSALPGGSLPDAGAASPQEPWIEPSGKIDAFIAANPDEGITANALRIRQAMLLLSYGKTQLADQAFKMVSDTGGLSARDTALLNLSSDLIWWFELNKSGLPDHSPAATGMKNLQTEIGNLGGSNENVSIRDYLAEMRAWIGLHRTRFSGTTNTAIRGGFLRDAVDNYTATLSSQDLTAIKNRKPNSSDEPLGLNVRRQIRALKIMESANARTRSLLEDDPNFTFEGPNSLALWEVLSKPWPQ